MSYNIPYFYLQPASPYMGRLHPIEGYPNACVVQQSLNIMVPTKAPEGAVALEDAQVGDEMGAFDTLEYLDLRMGAALNHGVSLLDVLDCHDQNLWAAAEDLLNLRRSSALDLILKPKVARVTGGNPWVVGDWVYVYSESFADSDIGLAAMETVLAHSNAGLAVIGLAGLRPNAPAEERRVAKDRVRNLALIGFARVPGTIHLVMDLSFKQPSVLD